MCRIIGLVSLKSFKIDIENFKTMRDTMVSGGPDAEGIWISECGGMVMGHRRLSILDISDAGNQPMHSASNRYVISYNGEVYNFKEVRASLEKLGHVFYTACDTEVVLAAFEEFGADCAKLFHGMFAIAIWDKCAKKLTLIRDRIGVKPLYFYLYDNIFIFSSELKAIAKFKNFQKVIDTDGLSSYFKYGYIPTPYTIFRGCSKLEAGHYLTLDKNGIIDSKRWWTPSTDNYSDFDWNNDDAVLEETKRCLMGSFERRLVSDVDVGLFLSGGVDSGLLASILSQDLGVKLSTFNVGFSDERYDESSAASYLAKKLGTKHHFTELNSDACKKLIPRIYDVWDEPFADTSTISTFLVCEFASKHVKVALSADGGDELFSGYPKHWLTLERAQILQKFTWTKDLLKLVPDTYLDFFSNFGLANKLLKTKEIISKSDPQSLLLNSFIVGQQIYTGYQLSKLLRREITELDDFTYLKCDDFLSELEGLNQLLYADLITYHTDNIHFKIDRASMAHSLEAREPYLDQDVLNLAFNMPASWKIKRAEEPKGKYVLRKIFSEYVNEEYVKLPKKGFGVPLDRWLLDDLNYLIDHYLGEQFLNSQSLFDVNEVRNVVKQFKRYPQKELNKLWSLISFQLWYEEWMG